MHSLVKEATGIDFNSFGEDLESAKNAARGIKTESNENISLQACSSVGHVLNEVSQLLFSVTLFISRVLPQNFRKGEVFLKFWT